MSANAAAIESLINNALRKKPAAPKGLEEAVAAHEARRELKVAAAKADRATAKAARHTAVAGRKIAVTTGKAMSKKGAKGVKAAKVAKRAMKCPAAVAIDDSLEDSDDSMLPGSDEPTNDAVITSAIAGRGVRRGDLSEDPLFATFGGDFVVPEAPMRSTPLLRPRPDPTTTATAAPAVSSAAAEEDTAAAGSSYEFLSSLANANGSTYVSQDALLADADAYFGRLNVVERRRNKAAASRLREMKRVNRAGGDAEGFKYVIPKSTRTMASLMDDEDGATAPAVRLSEAGVDNEGLQSHFLGDAVKETETYAKSETRRRAKRTRNHDDFYQTQVAQKWTENAERFLNRGKTTKNMFITRQQKLRSSKNL